MLRVKNFETSLVAVSSIRHCFWVRSCVQRVAWEPGRLAATPRAAHSVPGGQLVCHLRAPCAGPTSTAACPVAAGLPELVTVRGNRCASQERAGPSSCVLRFRAILGNKLAEAGGSRIQAQCGQLNKTPLNIKGRGCGSACRPWIQSPVLQKQN